MATITETRTVRYQVVTPLAIIPDETQGQVYLYRDQLLPTNTPAALVDHLVTSGVVRPV